MEFVNTDCPHIAIENPIGYMNTHFRKPDCIIQPWMFGDPYRKATCLWLKNLPPLTPTNTVEEKPVDRNGFNIDSPLHAARDENGKSIPWDDPRTAVLRSKTFPGIAAAMADQWYPVILNGKDDSK